jgi:AcrR family transcriptional regulator
MVSASNREELQRDPRTYDPEATKAALIESATKLFEAKGFHNTSTQEIVDQAGLTKGALYHHFAQKEDLLALIHSRFINEYFVLTKPIQGQGLEPIAELRELVRAVVTVNGRFHREVVIFAQERRALRSERYYHLRETRRDITLGFSACIERGQQSGDFRRDLDPLLSARAILGMCGWMSQWYFDTDTHRYEEIAEAFSSYALRIVI